MIAFLALCVVVRPLWGLTSQPYSRYQPIVDRQMFGPLPVGFDPDKLPSEVVRSASEKQLTKEQEEIKKAIRFMAINKASDGAVMVGFADFANPKSPVTYYLKVGESQGDWTVCEADPETAVMTIVNKEGVEVTLTLGGDSTKDALAVSAGASAAGASTSAAALPARSAGNLRSNLFNGSSLRTLRLQRQAQDAAEKERVEKERQAERQAEREERQRELQALKEEIQQMRTSQVQPKEEDNATPPPEKEKEQ